jgi:nucleotide-binding universal stress UspA family protein
VQSVDKRTEGREFVQENHSARRSGSYRSSCQISVAHNPEEFSKKLEEFGRDQASRYGHDVTVQAIQANDPASELDDAILKSISALGADLVIMASHVPTVADYIWPSNGGKIASHAGISVFLVR